MNHCVIYYKEILSTVSPSDCTFSFQKELQAKLQIDKDSFFEECLNKHHLSNCKYEIAKRTDGKPYLSSHPELKFNISHTVSHLNPETVSCIVIGFSSEEIGVDAEYLRPVKSNLARKICAPVEYSAYETCSAPDEYLVRLWTLKEAYVKYTGSGLRTDFKELHFEQITDLKELHFKQQTVNDSLSVYALRNHPEVLLYQYSLPNNLWISVCTKAGANAPDLCPVLVSC